jgi:5-methylcytosine-specific restriction enzyme A
MKAPIHRTRAHANALAASRREMERRRGTAAERGYDRRWAQARKQYLRQHPWCVQCAEHGRRTQATVVDHVVPHKGNTGLFWDEQNWQALCDTHHSRKTCVTDGGFGNVSGNANRSVNTSANRCPSGYPNRQREMLSKEGSMT